MDFEDKGMKLSGKVEFQMGEVSDYVPMAASMIPVTEHLVKLKCLF